jgi:hypothetical protein
MSAACKSMGGGCADPMERVWEEMDVSGENESGAMLQCRAQVGSATGEGLVGWREVCDATRNFSGAQPPRFQVGRRAL